MHLVSLKIIKRTIGYIEYTFLEEHAGAVTR